MRLCMLSWARPAHMLSWARPAQRASGRRAENSPARLTGYPPQESEPWSGTSGPSRALAGAPEASRDQSPASDAGSGGRGASLESEAASGAPLDQTQISPGDGGGAQLRARRRHAGDEASEAVGRD